MQFDLSKLKAVVEDPRTPLDLFNEMLRRLRLLSEQE